MVLIIYKLFLEDNCNINVIYLNKYYLYKQIPYKQRKGMIKKEF